MDELATVDSLVSNLDSITHSISYYPVMEYIEAKMLKMSINEIYSSLLTYKVRLESSQSNASTEA